MKNQVAELTHKIDDLENRQRQNNLLIFGLPEKQNEKPEDLLRTVKTNVFSLLEVNPTSIERMHRLGKRRGKDRPVIFRLMDSREKNDIMRNCAKLKGSSISISEDFSKRVLYCRKRLWESAQEDKRNGSRLRLLRDKLSVDGRLYYWDEQTKSRISCDNAPCPPPLKTPEESGHSS